MGRGQGVVIVPHLLHGTAADLASAATVVKRPIPSSKALASVSSSSLGQVPLAGTRIRPGRGGGLEVCYGMEV